MAERLDLTTAREALCRFLHSRDRGYEAGSQSDGRTSLLQAEKGCLHRKRCREMDGKDSGDNQRIRTGVRLSAPRRDRRKRLVCCRTERKNIGFKARLVVSLTLFSLTLSLVRRSSVPCWDHR